MASSLSLKKQLRHFDQIAYVFLIIVLGYFFIFLLIIRFALGVVNFESLTLTGFIEVFNISFYVAFFGSILFVVYPSIKAFYIRKEIYKTEAPRIYDQYRAGAIFSLILFISLMALVFWLTDRYLVGTVVQLMILDFVAIIIVFFTYGLGVRGLDLPKGSRRESK